MHAEEHTTREFLLLQDALRGRYALERELGRGGMGIVFLARESALERQVAIKLLLPQLAHDGALRERFLREARTAAQLMHPNIVPIHSVESRDDVVCFVMAFVEGETLTERVARRGTLSPEEAQRIMRDVTWALAYAHGKGVVHRDIKPDNILLEHESGRALVADFGIARVLSKDTLSEDGSFVGTVQYMSREQASADAVDGRSDLYSLAATIYFGLTGESPVTGPTLPAMLTRLATEESPSIALARADLPAPFAEILSRAMARDRDARTPSAEALTVELQSLERADPAIRPEVRSFLREVATGAPVLLLGLVAALGAGGLWATGAIPREGGLIVMVIGGLFSLMPLTVIVSGMRNLRSLGVPYEDVESGVAEEIRNLEWHRRRLLTAKVVMDRHQLAGWIYIGLGIVSTTAMAIGIFLDPRDIPSHIWVLGSFAIPEILAGTALVRGWRPRGRFATSLFGSEQLQQPGADDWLLSGLRWLLRRSFTRRLFGKRGASSTPSAVAPTATLLLKRVEDLVKQLPPELSARLPEVIPVAGQLERVGAMLRARIQRVDRALAELPPGSAARREFEGERARSAERLADCVTSLEGVRTDLLRLSVGIGHTDGLTLALEKARELGAAIDAELHGMDEARKLAP